MCVCGGGGGGGGQETPHTTSLGRPGGILMLHITPGGSEMQLTIILRQDSADVRYTKDSWNPE